MDEDQKSSALPEAWIVPIRLAIYSILAACSAYIYFNVGRLVFTHYLIVISIVAVSAMVLLDCRVSDNYWKHKAVQSKTSGNMKSGTDNGDKNQNIES